MARMHPKQILYPGNVEMRNEGLVIKDSNGTDEWLLVVNNGEIAIEPINKSATRRSNLDTVLNMPKVEDI